MEKLNLQTLKQMRERLVAKSRFEDTGKKVRITVHMGTCGVASGAQKIYDKIVEQIKDKKLVDIALTTGVELEDPGNPSEMILTTSGCAGMCCNEPMMSVKVAGRPSVMYQKLTEDKAVKIVEEHVVGGNVVTKYALAMGPEAIY
jgi:NADP-reducing hydrogenase subunit HndB